MAQKKPPAKNGSSARQRTPPPRKLSRTPPGSHELGTRVASLLEIWEDTARDPSLRNIQKLAKVSAELEAGARRVREQAEAFAKAARVTATSLKSIQEGAPAAAPGARPLAERVEEDETRKLGLFDTEPVSFEASFEPPEKRDAAVPGKADMPLQSFFEQVSDSVVKAQQRLDLASIAYSQGLKDSPIPPSYFSIPKVTAEIKLGLTVEDGSSLLVKLFGRPEDTTNFSETTVSFDVVASAPPPGGPGVYSAPIPVFLVVGPERNTVAETIVGIRDLIRDKTGIDLSTDPAQWLPSAIVVRAGSDILPAASRADYLVLRRDDDPGKPLLAVRFSLAKPREARIVKVTDADLRLSLFDLVAKIRDWESSVTLPVAKA